MPKAKHEQMDFKGLEIVADEFTGSVNGSVVVADLASVNPLGGTVGTANDTMTQVADATAASTDTSAASLTSVNTAIASINNNLADLQAKVNTILNALKA